MKVKKILAAVLLCGCLLLGGCEKEETTEDIYIYGKYLNYDDDTFINMDIKYTLKGFEKEETENGCIVTIYYELKEG